MRPSIQPATLPSILAKPFPDIPISAQFYPLDREKTPNIYGMARGKWVQNLGALGYWIPAAAVIVLGTAMFIRHGSATPITSENIVPAVDLNHALAWSTIAFAFSGVESISLVATQATRSAPLYPSRNSR